ncbi:MAG: dockerin type I repeat-containing protein [Dehalococcoidia bacterium]
MTKIGKSKVLKLCVAVAIALFLLLPSIALAHMTTACRIYGPVTRCGERVLDGTVVSAWLEENPSVVWNTTTYNHNGASWYVIEIPAEGAVDGDEVHFSVLGMTPSGENGKWQRGQPVYHALRLPCCIPGDANGDGVVDVGDITMVKLIIMGLAPPTPCADANQDGDINVGDITKIKLIIMGIDC